MWFTEIERRGMTAQQDRQFVVENFNDLLTGRDAAQNGFAKRFVSDPRDEFLCNLKIDIGLEKRQSDLPQRGVDVRLADFSVAAEILENLLQLIAELRKHGTSRAKSRDLFLWCRSCCWCWSSTAFVDPERPMRFDFFVA